MKKFPSRALLHPAKISEYFAIEVLCGVERGRASPLRPLSGVAAIRSRRQGSDFRRETCEPEYGVWLQDVFKCRTLQQNEFASAPYLRRDRENSSPGGTQEILSLSDGAGCG